MIANAHRRLDYGPPPVQVRQRRRVPRAAGGGEWERCAGDVVYFLRTYVKIYDATAKDWIAFDLWEEQESTLATIAASQLIVILKARQLGLTWLCLGYVLWLMLFHPAATALLFSRRDDEAIYLLSDERLNGMVSRLPDWLRPRVTQDSKHIWAIDNGSIARAFPTSAGDSYTATVAIVDEADLVPDLGKLMRAVKPTIDGGGKLILLSRTDKGKPNSEFKRIYRGAKAGANGWAGVFLPWSVRPGRDAAWYEAQRKDVLSRTCALDDLHEQYPATDLEALAPRSLDKRISAAWLEQCYQERGGVAGGSAIPDLVIYALPAPRRAYAIGIDSAEGNPTSDDSALTVMDVLSGEEVAMLKGKLQPSTLAAYADRVGMFYNFAAVLPERNNHGHAVILWLQSNSPLRILHGLDDRPGWLSHHLGKTLMYATLADAARDRQCTIHTFETYLQLASIDGSTLRAPEGEMDDLADSYALAYVATMRAAESQEQQDDDDDRVRVSTY